MAVVGVVPAAGHATRLQPISGSKEIQLVRGRPVMDYLIDRMVLAGCDRLRIVVRPEKQDVADHGRRLGAEIVTGYPATVSGSLLRGMEGLAADDIVLFGFPDTIWSPRDGFVPLRAAVEAGAPLALGIFGSPYPARSDVAVLDRNGRVVRIDVKPEAPETSLVWACGAARASILRPVGSWPEPGQFFSQLAGDGPLAGVRLGRVIDIGTREAFESARQDVIVEDDSRRDDTTRSRVHERQDDL